MLLSRIPERVTFKRWPSRLSKRDFAACTAARLFDELVMTRFSRLTLALLLLWAVATVRPAVSQDLRPTHLKVVGGWHFLSQYKDFEEPFWRRRIPQTSHGRVTAEISAFDELGLKGTEIIRLMSLGLIDFGTSVLAYGAEADIEGEGVDLAGLSPTADIARIVSAAYLPVLDRFFQKRHKIKILALYPYPAQVVYCRDELKGLADLKGRKVRVGTRPIAEFVEALGGIAVNIPFGDVYAKMKQGAADCLVTGTLPGNAAKLYEVTSYIYPLSLGWSTAMQGVSLAAWNRLNPKVQDFLVTQIAELNRDIWGRTELETRDGLACNTSEGECRFGTEAHMQRVAVSEADHTLLQRVLRDVVLKRWAQRCGAECTAEWNSTVGAAVGLSAQP
jgi:TRAP-type C4-dicarboxylate transport system substrate-binding protein